VRAFWFGFYRVDRAFVKRGKRRMISKHSIVDRMNAELKQPMSIDIVSYERQKDQEIPGRKPFTTA